MIPSYLYLDDENGSVTTSMLDGFNDTGLVSITPLKLQRNERFEDVSDAIVKDCSQKSYQGIVIDLFLDGGGANSLKFKASPLVQQIRTLASEGKIAQMPVVLCSTAEKISFLEKDRASQDLFDHCFKKEDNPEEIAPKLQSLADGYAVLNSLGDNGRFGAIVKRSPESFYDNRVVDYLSDEALSTYDIAHRLKVDFIDHTGIMIEEDVVASRMGVDIEASGEGWKKLIKDIEAKAIYKGVFASGWRRFWADLVRDFFLSMSGTRPYQLLTSKERIDILDHSGYEGLVPATPIRLNQSSMFNTVCHLSRKPLDAQEGIPINDSMPLKPWQEREYLSLYSIVHGDYPPNQLGADGKRVLCELMKRCNHGEERKKE